MERDNEVQNTMVIILYTLVVCVDKGKLVFEVQNTMVMILYTLVSVEKGKIV